MSTRKKGEGIDLGDFLNRRHRMSNVRDQIMIAMRLYRNLLETRDGTEHMFGELAALVNTCGLYAQEQGRADWLDAMKLAAAALQAVSDRNERVGGRFAGTLEEVEAISVGLNAIEFSIMPVLPVPDFIRLADKVNAIAAREAA